MTNQEAIDHLLGMKGNGYPKQEQAIDMGVEAIKILDNYRCDNIVMLTREAYSELCLEASKRMNV